MLWHVLPNAMALECTRKLRREVCGSSFRCFVFFRGEEDYKEEETSDQKKAEDDGESQTIEEQASLLFGSIRL